MVIQKNRAITAHANSVFRKALVLQFVQIVCQTDRSAVDQTLNHVHNSGVEFASVVDHSWSGEIGLLVASHTASQNQQSIDLIEETGQYQNGERMFSLIAKRNI
jgi:hypothetical protein